ncbi:MAG: PLD nuclease N-terminal domain-containing protein [Gemmatimonadaceae bacterium]
MTQVPPGRSLLAGGWSWPLIAVSGAILSLVAALFSIWLGRHHSVKAKILWTVISLLLPLIGPLSWFLLGRVRRSEGRE